MSEFGRLRAALHHLMSETVIYVVVKFAHHSTPMHAAALYCHLDVEGIMATRDNLKLVGFQLRRT